MNHEWLAHVFDWVQNLQGAWLTLLGSAFGSTLGIISLLIGALYNARLNRKAEQRRELNDRFGIAEALIAEVVSVKQTIDRAAAELRDPAQGNVQALMPDPCPDRGVFDKFLSKIELFDENTIRIVTELYAVLNEYCIQVVVRGGGFDQSVKGRGTLVVRHDISEAIAVLNDSLSIRCADVLEELRRQRITWRHVVTRQLG